MARLNKPSKEPFMLRFIPLFAVFLNPLLGNPLPNPPFPPSQYEWKELFSESFFQIPAFQSEQTPKYRLFTHREGDALELFLTFQFPLDPEDMEEDETETLLTIQQALDENINSLFPNHHLKVLQYEEDRDENSISEWGLFDENTELLHGYARCLSSKDSYTYLFYLTTALPTEENRTLWTQFLNESF